MHFELVSNQRTVVFFCVWNNFDISLHGDLNRNLNPSDPFRYK